MIPNYTKPQSFIRQYLEVLTGTLAASLNAFIYGPQFRLSRYTDSTEKAETSNKTTATGRLDAALGADESLDQSFVKVYGDDLEIEVGSAIGDGTDTGFHLLSLAEPHKVVYKTATLATVTAVPSVDGRELQVGDYLDLTDNGDGDTARRQITGFEQSAGLDSVIILDGAATLHYVEATGADVWESATEEALTAQLVVKYSGEIASTEYAVNSAGVNLDSLPDVEVAGASASPYTVTTGVGTLYLHYRALVQPGANEPIRKIKTTADINTYFGKVDPDNTLGFALQAALNGSQGKEVYGTRVREESEAGYAEVLKKASQNLNLYAHCPLTYDIAIQKSVGVHVEAMSQWDVKRWRRVYVASDVPETWAVLEEDESNEDFEASIDTDGLLTVTSGNVDLTSAGVEAEDIIRTNFSEPSDATTYQDTYVVEKVLGPVTLILKTAPTEALNAEKFEAWKGNTGRAQAQYAANRSKQFGTRRVVNVWCDNGQAVDSDGSSRVVENLFLAAEIAGLRSAVLPHQGLTRTEISSISSAPLMYTKYDEADLDIAAASGVFVVTQDLEDGPIYIRHQLTTRTDKGSLYYEDSVGSNIDEISFGIAALIEGYIGKRNATPDTVVEIRNRINEFLHNKSRAERTVVIGPQLIDFTKEDLEVDIDSVLRDRINVKAFLTVPLPLNTIVVELFAGVTFNN